MKTLEIYRPVLAPLMHLMAKSTHFECRPGLAEVFEQNRRLMVAVSHATPLSWLPAISLLTEEGCRAGGSKRRPLGVMDRFFFQMPMLKELARKLTQAGKPPTYHELREQFLKDHEHELDLVLFPEGSNCFFGNPETIQEFRSPKFVELAILAETPILLVVHRGSENWARKLSVSDEWIDSISFLPKTAFNFLESRLRRTGKLVVPLWPQAMERFDMLCEVYRPTLSREALSEDPAERVQQIRREAERVRSRMNQLLAELDQKIARSRAQEQEVSLHIVDFRNDEKSKHCVMN